MEGSLMKKSDSIEELADILNQVIMMMEVLVWDNDVENRLSNSQRFVRLRERLAVIVSKDGVV